MDNYEQYIQAMVQPAPGIPTIVATGTGEASEPASAGEVADPALEAGEFVIDKTFAELEALYAKRALSRLTYHRADGSKVVMCLAYVGDLDGKRAFVFSVAPSAHTDYGFGSFALDEDDVLTYGDAFECDATLAPVEA